MWRNRTLGSEWVIEAFRDVNGIGKTVFRAHISTKSLSRRMCIVYTAVCRNCTAAQRCADYAKLGRSSCVINKLLIHLRGMRNLTFTRVTFNKSKRFHRASFWREPPRKWKPRRTSSSDFMKINPQVSDRKTAWQRHYILYMPLIEADMLLINDDDAVPSVCIASLLRGCNYRVVALLYTEVPPLRYSDYLITCLITAK